MTPIGVGASRAALKESVDEVRPVIKTFVDQHGWGELLEVAEELGLHTEGLVWWEQTGEAVQEGKLHVTLSDLQFIAFCAALTANDKTLQRFYGTAG